MIPALNSEVLVVTDASSTVGGGGWMSLEMDEKATAYEAEEFLLWTPEEIESFKVTSHRGAVDINVLEFFCSAYFILLWG
jgi:hypothetical protein